MSGRPLQVLIVDDSAVARESIGLALSCAGMLAATAPDPIVARRRMAATRPDVIVLDLAMPREDGLTFLRELMAHDPIPVIICSSHSPKGSSTALEALHEGAVDVVEKPRFGVREFVQESATLLTDAVHAAASARPQPRMRRANPAAPPRTAATVRPRGALSRGIVAIAASTGGPQALHEILGGLPADAPGIVVVQHMPGTFTPALARHLDETSRISVKEAVTGDAVHDGLALIAPGGQHLVVHAEVGGYSVEVAPGPLVSRHRPSADVLFRSVARAAGSDAVGVILTGMGDDGAAGLLAMKQAGARTIAQDESSCVVFGMPKEAIACGAVDEVLPLNAIAAQIVRHAARQAA